MFLAVTGFSPCTMLHPTISNHEEIHIHGRVSKVTQQGSGQFIRISKPCAQMPSCAFGASNGSWRLFQPRSCQARCLHQSAMVTSATREDMDTTDTQEQYTTVFGYKVKIAEYVNVKTRTSPLYDICIRTEELFDLLNAEGQGNPGLWTMVTFQSSILPDAHVLPHHL